MKIALILVVALIFFRCGLNSQSGDEKQDVRRAMNKMSELIMKQNYEAVYEMSYPGSYGSNSKEEVLQDLRSSLHGQGYSLEIKNIYIDSISEVYSHNSNKYALVNHSTAATLSFNRLPGEDSTKMFERFNKFCTNGKQMINNGEYFSCNQEKKSIFYKQKDFTFFIYKHQDKKWYVLTTGSFSNVPNAIPDEVLKKLKRYKTT